MIHTLRGYNTHTDRDTGHTDRYIIHALIDIQIKGNS